MGMHWFSLSEETQPCSSIASQCAHLPQAGIIGMEVEDC